MSETQSTNPEAQDQIDNYRDASEIMRLASCICNRSGRMLETDKEESPPSDPPPLESSGPSDPSAPPPEASEAVGEGVDNPAQYRDRSVLLGMRLAKLFEAEEAMKWLYSPHNELGGLSARTAIDAGRLSEVEAIVERLETGAFG
jgi:hypothetical protein